MGTMSKTLTAIEQLYFLKKIWHYHNLFLRPPKSFLDPYQDVSPNIMQLRTNRKFLNKYVKNANGQWTALISWIKSGITTTYF